MSNTVFLLTSGDGSDGDEWGVISIHSSREFAETAQVKYSEPQKNIYGGTYIRQSEIEEWAIDENAAQQSMHPTLLTARRKLVTCPQCQLVFGIDLPASQSG
jgi:hypothetical protein